MLSGGLDDLHSGTDLRPIKPFQEFLTAYELLGKQDRLLISQVVSALGKRHGLTISSSMTSDELALGWTSVQIADLNWFSLTEISGELYQKGIYPANPDWEYPYLQCLYCGQRDRHEKGHFKPYKKKWLCHKKTCPSEQSPSEHHEGCCYKVWRNEKNALSKALKRCVSEQERVKKFLEFCEKCFKRNSASDRPSIRSRELYKWESILNYDSGLT